MNGPGFTALGLGLYHPVSGNWCWIQEHPTYLRYVLTHMWRFLSIFLSAGIYIYIYFWVHRHFREIKMLGSNGYRGHSGDPDAEGGLEDNILEFSDTIALKSAAAPLNSEAASTTSHTGVNVAKSIIRNEDSTQNRGRSYSIGGNPLPTEAFVKRTLLLNAYPIMYIFLWIPGIANRIAEATDHPSRALTIMQATTQYVGLANAITYGLNEKVLRQLQAYISKE
ncbi:MAG: hypothetical protein M1825_004363 [Sarcosagium campestre]|nr:MAG: hypothetical protein M1825_004363 [Sarcosagium campestre]